MKTILFIYGYGSSPASRTCGLLMKYLPPTEYKVLCYKYPQEDCATSVEFFEEKIIKKHIDLVIGTSLGGFLTLCLDTDIPRIVLNPCMVPTVELPKLKPYPGHIGFGPPSDEVLETYRRFENGVNSGEFCKNSTVIGLFAENDELLGLRYFRFFGKNCGDARYMPGGHHCNKEAMPVIVQTIAEILSGHQIIKQYQLQESKCQEGYDIARKVYDTPDFNPFDKLSYCNHCIDDKEFKNMKDHLPGYYWGIGPSRYSPNNVNRIFKLAVDCFVGKSPIIAVRDDCGVHKYGFEYYTVWAGLEAYNTQELMGKYPDWLFMKIVPSTADENGFAVFTNTLEKEFSVEIAHLDSDDCLHRIYKLDY